MVWGRSCRMDYLHAFFSGALARRVYLCARSQQQQIECTNAGLPALRTPARLAGVVNVRVNKLEFPADSRAQLETKWNGQSRLADCRAIERERGPAIFYSLVHWTALAILVRWNPQRLVVPFIRSFQFWVVSCAFGVPSSAGARTENNGASVALVSHVPYFCPRLFLLRSSIRYGKGK